MNWSAHKFTPRQMSWSFLLRILKLLSQSLNGTHQTANNRPYFLGYKIFRWNLGARSDGMVILVDNSLQTKSIPLAGNLYNSLLVKLCFQNSRTSSDIYNYPVPTWMLHYPAFGYFLCEADLIFMIDHGHIKYPPLKIRHPPSWIYISIGRFTSLLFPLFFIRCPQLRPSLNTHPLSV